MTEITFYVPCLNEEKNIQESLNTIIQSCKVLEILKYEILVYNDCSNDNYLEKIEEFRIKNYFSGKLELI